MLIYYMVAFFVLFAIASAVFILIWRHHRNFHAYIDNILDAVIVINDSGLIEYFNPAAEKIFGYDKKEVLFKNISMLMPEQYSDEHDVNIKKYIQTGVKHIIGKGRETYAMRKNGCVFPIYIAVSEVKSNNERKFIGIIQDITERKLEEGAIKKSRDEALETCKAKSEFLASMSHEIRTPINAIIGMADLLADTHPDREQLQYIGIFQKASEHLLCLINDILDITKIEAGYMEFEYTSFYLIDLIEKVQDIMAVKAHQKGLELAYHISSDVPKYIIGDQNRLSQVLINLVGNSIKFTNNGEVVIYIKKLNKDNDNPDMPAKAAPAELLFEVRDTGIGIPPDKIDKIFDNFNQGQISTTRKYGGTGLGLTISKKIVELMGGRIWVDSKLNKGTSFYFSIKLDIASSQSPVDLIGLSTLIIDDNATNRRILREHLTSWGAKVTESESGEEGLARLMNAERSGEPYQLVLLDIRMPEMDGFEVAKNIKKEARYENTIVLMLTSDDREGDIEKSKRLGIYSYLIKPIKKMELYRAITEAVTYTKKYNLDIKKEGQDYISQLQTNGTKKNILLVEDSEDGRTIIEYYLKNLPFNIDIAEDGVAAVNKFKSKKYDMVLMDIQLPVMDGYTATRLIREWESEKGLEKTSIIALTANAFKEDKQKGFEAGCDDYLIKPVTKSILLSTLEKHLYNIV